MFQLALERRSDYLRGFLDACGRYVLNSATQASAASSARVWSLRYSMKFLQRALKDGGGKWAHHRFQI